MAKTTKGGTDTGLGARMKRFAPFYVMFAPVFLLLILFYYLPMLGIRYAFFKFTPFNPNPTFIGFQNFANLFQNSRFWDAFNNTIILSFVNLVLSMIFSVGIALLINEIQNTIGKKFVQTVIYLPHFLSWVVVAAIFTLIFASDGLVNSFVGGTENWLTNKNWWRPIWYFINRWKETGWGTIIFLAAVTGISPDLYEAAEIDGAGRLKQTWYITIPSLMNTILVVFILNLAKIMNVFESVFVLYNDLVYSVSDVIQTYTYRAMKDRMDYGYSTAVGLFKSVVSLILVLGANYVSGRIRGRGII
jgi:putative aldouronate transport system permease protein